VRSFDSTEVKNFTEVLSSPALQGRLTGTKENKEVSEYIKSWFIHNDLEPYLRSYFDSFEVIYPKRLEKRPYLRVLDNEGNIIHEFKYGIDYKEDMLSFKDNLVRFNINNSRQIDNTLLQAFKDNSSYIFYVSENNDLNFRSSFYVDSFVSMCVFLTDSSFNTVKDYLNKNLTVECYIPYKQDKTTANNVLGVIKGKDTSKPPIILSCHFDHLGTDLSGTVYPGALDNASGTAFVLEMGKFLKSLGKPERSIIFIAFNAEEFGCLGSKAFVEKYKHNLKGAKVFNFDMIGSDYGVPLCIMGAESDTAETALVKSAASVCSDENILFSYLFKNSSDHEYFRKNGIDAITFSDNDMSKIHTPLDLSEYISLSAIERCFKIVSKEVIKYAYNNNPLILYNNQVLMFSVTAIIALILISALLESKNSKKIN
jgi:Zn-dependent M28 family amino/carboxypeptidase